MKWLQNSDLNKNEGSFDIFKAICNENEEEEDEVTDDLHDFPKDLTEKSTVMSKFSSKLKNVQKNLQQLEAEIENEMDNEELTRKVKQEFKEEEEDSSDEDEEEHNKEGACADEEFIVKRNGNSAKTNKQVLSTENKKYLLLKSSVDMLREAYNEICNTVQEQQGEIKDKQDKDTTPPPNIKVKTQFQAYAKSPTAVSKKKYETNTKLPTSCTESDVTESDSEVESITLAAPLVNKDIDEEKQYKLQEQLKEYEQQVKLLNEKLQQTELEAQQTLEIMQVECDDVKLKMQTLNKTIENLKNDNKALEKVIQENTNTNLCAEEQQTNKTCLETKENLHDKDLDLEEDEVLKAINLTVLEREEELITYKERLDQQQQENIDLRNEIALLKLKANTALTTKDILLKQYLPCSFIVLAIIIYFLTTYY